MNILEQIRELSKKQEDNYQEEKRLKGILENEIRYLIESGQIKLVKSGCPMDCAYRNNIIYEYNL